MIEDLIKALEDTRKVKELLEEVYREIGCYGDGEVTSETLRALNSYFDFDDSE